MLESAVLGEKIHLSITCVLSSTRERSYNSPISVLHFNTLPRVISVQTVVVEGDNRSHTYSQHGFVVGRALCTRCSADPDIVITLMLMLSVTFPE